MIGKSPNHIFKNIFANITSRKASISAKKIAIGITITHKIHKSNIRPIIQPILSDKDFCFFQSNKYSLIFPRILSIQVKLNPNQSFAELLNKTKQELKNFSIKITPLESKDQ